MPVLVDTVAIAQGVSTGVVLGVSVLAALWGFALIKKLVDGSMGRG